MFQLFVLAITSALLVGCAAQVAVSEHDAPTEPESAITVRERPFPNDSLYPLLVAEFALRRQAYDVALEQYIGQAGELRDSGVSEHTTHLAQFLKREEEALEAAALWVELDPKNTEANNTLAQLLARQGRVLEALPYLIVVQRETGDANFPVLLNGFEQLGAAQRAELVRDTNALAAEFPKNTNLLLTQALIQAETGQLDSALDKLDTLLDLEPEQTTAILLEAKILADQNTAKPYGRLQQMLQNNPDDNLLRLQYARLLTATDMRAAREQFEFLSEQHPDDGDLLFSLALINDEIDDPEAARGYLLQTIALGQRVDEAYYYLGRIAEEDKNTEEALSRYMQIGFGPEYLAANNRIGHILIEGDQLKRYHARFVEQRQKYPHLRDQLYTLEAAILIEAGAQTAALQVLNQALLETPNSISLRYERAMLNEQLNNLASMEQDLRTIIAADPDNTTALNALGYTLANRTTRYDEALHLISRALVLEPDEPAILDSMGWVMFRTEQYAASVNYLTRAYTGFPDAEVASHLGEALWAQGKTDAAMAIWQGALLREPDHPVLLDTLDRLGIDLPVGRPPQAYPVESLP
jgi:tetratricopeptide (TPR) repeat protein